MQAIKGVKRSEQRETNVQCVPNKMIVESLNQSVLNRSWPGIITWGSASDLHSGTETHVHTHAAF